MIDPGHRAFLELLQHSPEDVTARLAYADWLQENPIPPDFLTKKIVHYLTTVKKGKFIRRVRRYGVTGIWNQRTTIREHLGKFVDYYQKPGNGAWGSLHVVLNDGNYDDGSVEGCIEWANDLTGTYPDGRPRYDADGVVLGKILLQMSRTQRSKIGRMAEAYARIRRGGDNPTVRISLIPDGLTFEVQAAEDLQVGDFIAVDANGRAVKAKIGSQAFGRVLSTKGMT